MKTEVYSWRVRAALKRRLEAAARRRGTSVAAVLDDAAQAWLDQRKDDDDNAQRRLHDAARPCVGAWHGERSDTSARVREMVTERVRERTKRR